MQFPKTTCVNCPQLNDCPQKTRMFVKYCGSRQAQIAASVRGAILECHTRRGYILKSFPQPYEYRESA